MIRLRSYLHAFDLLSAKTHAFDLYYGSEIFR